MEMEEIKMSRILSNKISEDEDDGEQDRKAMEAINESNRLRAWHSSRIFRVSRASGGKDRHSKVLTAKGLRDRRVRLSVSTAIQFYDLQDRLGYDQPSKAVEWLIKAAADSIDELPSLDSKYPIGSPKPPSEDEKLIGGFELESSEQFQHQQHHNHQSHHHQQQQHSSPSETSKGSVLSLSRSEIRVKARERARERAAKDKDKEQQMDECHCAHQQNSQNSSFTELLTSGHGGGGANNNSPNQSPGFFLKQARHSPTTPMDYFSSGLFGPTSSSRNHFTSGFSSQQSHFGMTNNMPQFNVPNHNHHHPELQQFSFLPDHLIPDAPASVGGNDNYNLNFSISSGLAGYNRGTLQSNSSPSTLPPHLQRFSSSPGDGSNMPFYVGNATPTPDNQLPAGFDGRLQLYYGDGSRHSDTKGKRSPEA